MPQLVPKDGSTTQTGGRHSQMTGDLNDIKVRKKV